MPARDKGARAAWNSRRRVRMRSACRPKWTAFVSRTAHVPVSGSIARLVPVKPVCDTESGGQVPRRMSKRSPWRTQPRPRQPSSPAVWRRSAARRSRAGTATSSSPAHQAANASRSATGANRPAWPATPPISLAFSSCTTPAHGVPSGPCSVAAKPSSAMAVRPAAALPGAVGLKPVLFMPSGPVTR